MRQRRARMEEIHLDASSLPTTQTAHQLAEEGVDGFAPQLVRVAAMKIIIDHGVFVAHGGLLVSPKRSASDEPVVFLPHGEIISAL